jgi:peptide chain release factor 1
MLKSGMDTAFFSQRTKMEDKLNEISNKLKEIEERMSNPEVISDQNLFKKLNQERTRIAPIVQASNEFKKMKQELSDSKELLETESDDEMKEMLQSEVNELEEKIKEYDEKLLIMLLPKDPSSGKDVIMEIRAGTGGDEAALFAADLLRMYNRYSDIKGWKLEFIDGNYTEIGGYKEVIFSIRSPEAYDNLKYESGVHRVQRVPTTESGGRVHTSAVTVAVLSEAEDDDVEVDPADLRIDVYRASGHGGQSVNTTDSAVRITHVPTGMIVTCQDEKSQHKNKAKAMRVLRARLFEKINKERMDKESELRRAQVGSGDRSERIRTYNFPQSRVTDHRIGLTLYSLENVLDGSLDDVVEPLKKDEVQKLLKVTGK